MDDLVSVIIPTYNTNNSLKRAIKSVLDQTYMKIEIIVVDDNNLNSTGRKNCERIMQCYKLNSKVKYVKHKQNINGSAARNTGVANSKGFYIAFLDDDDFFYKEKIEKQIQFMKKNNYDFCSCYCKIYKNIYSFKIKENYISDVLFLKKAPQTSSFVLTKNLFLKLNGFDETYIRHQDYEFLIRACLVTKIGILPEVLYERANNNVDNRAKGEKLEKVKEKFLSDFENVITLYKINKKKIIGKNYASVFLAYIREKNYKDALRIFKQHFNIYLIFYICTQCIKIIIFKLTK